jgi:hypothetical protein
MPKELEFDCEDGRCTWRWNANDYPVDEVSIRLRHPNGDSEVRTIPNTGELVLPDDQVVEEIITRGSGGETRQERWRGPGD